MARRRLTSLLLLAGLIGLVGCGKGGQLGEVQGTVKVNGKPLDKIQVEFWPEGKGDRAIGVTDDSGRYTLMAADGKTKGAAIGKHRVVLKDVGIMGDKFLGRAGEDVDMAKGKKPRIGGQFTDPDKTPLKKDVTSGQNTIDLEATP